MARLIILLKSLLSFIINKSAFIVLIIVWITLLTSCTVMLDPPGGERHRFRNERGDRHERDNHDEHRDNDEHRN